MAVSVEFGKERTATPDKNATNLIHREISNQQLFGIGVWIRVEFREGRQRRRDRHRGVKVGRKNVLYGRSIVQATIKLRG